MPGDYFGCGHTLGTCLVYSKLMHVTSFSMSFNISTMSSPFCLIELSGDYLVADIL